MALTWVESGISVECYVWMVSFFADLAHKVRSDIGVVEPDLRRQRMPVSFSPATSDY